MTDRRFIEESFPVKEVGEASAHEKNIRHGHISTLHIWWARRPLAASRATAYAALTPAPKDIEEWQRKRDFIIQLCQWENSNNQVLLDKARRDILQAHAECLSEELGEKVSVEDIESGKYPRPRVLDPFAGGGSYPLEALHLGCEAYANDYNPVAVLIEKATLEYPQKFGRPFEGMPEWAYPQGGRRKDEGGRGKKDKDSQPALFAPSTESQSANFNPLLNAVRYWGEWVLEEARKELAEFYPPDPDGSIPVGYIWARTIPCQNPACGQEIPLMRQFWLAKTNKKKVALYPDTSNGSLEFKIVGNGYKEWPKGFDPDEGTVARAVATCLMCGSVIDANTTRRLFQECKSGQRMIAVVLYSPKHKDLRKLNQGGKYYRIANSKDEEIYHLTEDALLNKREYLLTEWGIEPVPDEPLTRVPVLFGVINVWVYGMSNWGDLFNTRQKFALITFANIVRRSYIQMISEGITPDFAKAVVTYLAMTVSRSSDFMTNLFFWMNHVENAGHVFARQAIPMSWDYFELNMLSPVSQGTWESMSRQILLPLELLSQVGSKSSSTVYNTSATNLKFPDGYFDAVLTDPPYYDNVPYSYLSDFFYVWLKRIIGDLYPDLFSTPLTPKAGEIVAYLQNENDPGSGKRFFEDGLKHAFQEVFRVLKPKGIAVVVYAYKFTEGWETVINALLDSGLVVKGAWPLYTELEGRLRARDSAVLASSIYIVARKMPRQPTGFYNDVRTELRRHLDAKLERLWAEGIGGADFFIAAIGSAIEVFGKYEQVMDYEGNIVRANRLLEEVRTIATDYAVRQILHNGFAAEISGLTRLYVLWRWNYGEALVPFDEGRKLAQSCGIDLSQQWSKNGCIKKEKAFIRLLGPQNRKLDDLDNPRDMIDVMHKALLLWEKSERAEMVKVLADRGFGRSEAFYRVAQAISETLPNESKEKKLLDGFLAGRERVQDEVEKAGVQRRLWEKENGEE